MSQSVEQVAQCPMHRQHPLSPPEELLELQNSRPISRMTWNGFPMWLVTRYDDARAILSDSRFSADSSRHGFPPIGPQAVNPSTRTLSRSDPPEHDIHRRLVMGEFTARRIDQLRPTVRKSVGALLDAMQDAERPLDLVQKFALPIPSSLISEMLGVPYSDHAHFERLVSEFSSTDAAVSAKGAKDLTDYVDGLVSLKEKNPPDDLLGRLVVEGRGVINHDETVRLARTLLAAGHETTANMLALSSLTLMQDHALRDSLLSGQSRGKDAVEELLRFHSILQHGAPRLALEDVDIRGQVIRAGEGVLVSLSAANRDDGIFSDPSKLDFCRPKARHHLAFGFGIHQCLGQNLARMELQEALPMLFTRYPDLKLGVPFEKLRFKHESITYGLYELPVTW